MVKSLNRTNRRKAFTLVEIMIAAICMSIIMGPIYMILRSGSDTSLKGMLRIDTTLKARNIMQQVYADLKMSCFKLNYEKEYSFDDLMKVEGDLPYITYSFTTFPIHEKFENIFENPSQDINWRKVSQITYRVEDGDNPNFPLKKLIREENFEGKITRRVLSEKINFFEIKPIPLEVVGKNQYYYLITLQLLDVLHAEDLKGKKAGERLEENQKDVILADFFDIVSPDYFNALWNDERLNPNWHTKIKTNGDE